MRASCCNSVFIMRLRSMKVLITIKMSYNTAEVPSLVDSGATDNFIHPRTIRQLCLGTSLLDKPKKLFNVDDTQNKAGSVTRYVDLSVTTNQKEQQMRFLVSNIRRESLILGYPWLVAFKPRFQVEGRHSRPTIPPHNMSKYPTSATTRGSTRATSDCCPTRGRVHQPDHRY